MKNLQNEIKAKGTYGDATKWMIEQGTYSRKELIQFLHMHCNKSIDRGIATISPAEATATILLTPRLSSNRGDIRGNVNNPWGHLAYNLKLPRTVNRATGKKDPQRFAFAFREEALDPLKRKVSKKLDASKDLVHSDDNKQSLTTGNAQADEDSKDVITAPQNA